MYVIMIIFSFCLGGVGGGAGGGAENNYLKSLVKLMRTRGTPLTNHL